MPMHAFSEDNSNSVILQANPHRNITTTGNRRIDSNIEDDRKLCLLYQLKSGVTPDEYKAFYYCSLAAESGHADAQFELGLLFLDGIGTEDSEEDAIHWLSRASGQGHEQAQRVLEYIFNGDFIAGC